MNRRAACLVIALGLMGVGVRAQQVPLTLPKDAYNSPGASKAVIEDFIKKNIEQLLNDKDAAAQARSRDVLYLGTMTAGQPASPEFLFEYARILNNEAGSKLDPKARSIRQRLNIGIVVARVAAVAQNGALADTALKLIKDPAEPVVLWGVKASQSIIPQVVKVKMGNQAPPLLRELVPAVMKHPTGVIVEEAYVALGSSSDPLVVDELMKLWENRLIQYRKGTPDDPLAESKPVFSLTTQDIWKSTLKDPARRTAVMTMIRDQMLLAATQADAAGSGDTHDQLVNLVKQCAAGVYVVGRHQGVAALEAAAKTPASLNAAALQPGTKVLPLVSPALVGEIKKAFPDVKAPGASVASDETKR